MLFGDDTETSLTAAVDLVNSAVEPDTLLDPADLEEFFHRHGYTGSRAGDGDEVAAVRAIRPRLREIVLAERDDAVALVNTALDEVQATPRLVRHGDSDWHIHAVPDDSGLAVRMLAETAMAMIDLIRADELSRLAQCADDECDGVVLDLSRNRSRKFCSTRCGNRAAVAAYRARQR